MQEIVTIPIPTGAEDFEFVNRDTKYLKYETTEAVTLAPMNVSTLDKYEIIGRLSELTDEQCEPLVEKNETKGIKYRDYTRTDGHFFFSITARESLISWCKANGKLCKWMVKESGVGGKFVADARKEMDNYNSLPDDLLILIKK